jgi:hypothetical protein
MKRSVCVAVVAVLVLLGVRTWAQGAENFVGIVKSVSGNSVTVERGPITGVFAVDSKTHITAKGSTAKTAENKAAGKPGLTVPDMVHTGDQVRVRYTFNETTRSMTVNDITVMESIASKK